MNELYRIEKDSLGEVKVPANAMWGAQTQRALSNFDVSGLRPHRVYILAIGMIKHAAAQVNYDLGLLSEQTCHAIRKAADEVIAGVMDDQFVVDPFQAGAGTSHNMNANEVIANIATIILGGVAGTYLVHPHDHVNMSQSTNDVIPTAIRLGCLYLLADLLPTIEKLQNALASKSVEFDDVLKSGRTHLQDAVPIRLGQEFGAYASAVRHDIDRIRRAAHGLHYLGIGGSAVGTGLNAHPEYHPRMIQELTRLTQMPLQSAENLFESMQSMADLVDFSAALRTLAVTITRIANDLRLLASGPATGLHEIILPSVQPGSSIMPGKVNPVIAEMVNMAMFHVMGNDSTITLAAQAGQLELNVMMPVIAHNLFEMMRVTTNALQLFTDKCVLGIEANREKASEWLEHNATLVTALNPLIGYAAGAALAQEAVSSKQTLRQIALKKAHTGSLYHIHKKRSVQVEEVENALSDLRRLTQGGLPQKTENDP